MKQVQRPRSSPSSDDPILPYESPLEHLRDWLHRLSDLIAASLLRKPRREGAMGSVRPMELMARAHARGTEAVPADVSTLLAMADARLDRIRARSRVTQAAGVSLPLVHIARTFKLDRREIDALLLVAAPHLDASFSAEWEHIENDALGPDVRFITSVLARDYADSIALRHLFAADSRLVRNALVIAEGRCSSEGDFLSQGLQVPRRVVAELLGDAAVDESLLGFSGVRVPTETLSRVVLPEASKQLVLGVTRAHGEWTRLRKEWGLDEAITYGRGIALLFSGPPGTGKTLLATALAGELKRRLFHVDVPKLVTYSSRDWEVNLDAIFREARMLDAVLFFDECEQLFTSRLHGNSVIPQLLTRLEHFEGIAVLATNMPEMLDEALDRRLLAEVTFTRPGPAAREAIWRCHLPERMPLAADVDVGRLAEEFELTGGLIKNAVLAAGLQVAARGGGEVTHADLDHGARLQLRVRAQEGQRVERPTVRLADVVLAPAVEALVRRLVATARVQATVLVDWGFEEMPGPTAGLVAMFSGPSGTGKSITAEAVAGELERPLLRASIPALLSKYVGETSKNLRNLFEQAREHRAVLLFDEADALFATRVEVKGATDRFANAETGALLAEVERFTGVVILTTNHAARMDEAFARRVGWKVGFAPPDWETRARLWRRMLPAKAPLDGDVDCEVLAEAAELTGGQIRNAVMAAACEAAAEGGQEGGRKGLTQGMLLRAACEQGGVEAPMGAGASRWSGVGEA